MTPARFWPALIVSLLAGNACIVAITVVASSRAPGGAIAPEYGRPDAAGEQTLHQQNLDRALGWSVEAYIGADTPRRLVVDARDASGRPIRVAQVVARLPATDDGGPDSLIRLAPGSHPGRFVGLMPDGVRRPARATIDIDAVGMHSTRDVDVRIAHEGRE